MSRRTAESNKAILAAWNREQELVQEGKGTREWTPKQQQDILEKGKAYDDGIAFQGQHMKSAEMYPEYQGDPENIQFLTRAEHLEAHNGNWRNPTNWYFDPKTKEKLDFGDGPFIPCKIIQLPEPVIRTSVTVEIKEETIIESSKKIEVKAEPKIKLEAEPIKDKSVNKAKLEIKQTGGIGNRVEKFCKSVIDFSERNSELIGIGIKIAVVFGVGKFVKAMANGGRSSSSNENSDDYTYTPSQNVSTSFNDSYDEVQIDTIDTDTSVERSSPKEHTVRSHGQHYIKNGERVWIEKNSYLRGGKKEE